MAGYRARDDRRGRHRCGLDVAVLGQRRRRTEGTDGEPAGESADETALHDSLRSGFSCPDLRDRIRIASTSRRDYRSLVVRPTDRATDRLTAPDSAERPGERPARAFEDYRRPRANRHPHPATANTTKMTKSPTRSSMLLCLPASASRNDVDAEVCTQWTGRRSPAQGGELGDRRHRACLAGDGRHGKSAAWAPGGADYRVVDGRRWGANGGLKRSPGSGGGDR